jgi:hypothetical protein
VATDAETMVSGTDISEVFADAITDVSDHCKRGFEMLNDGDIPEADREALAQKLEDHGLHAYRYEVMDDESVVALYANDPSGEVKFKTFEDMAQASKWSPRDERVKPDSAE